MELITSKQTTQNINFRGYYCDSQLSSLRNIKRIIKHDETANRLFQGLKSIKQQYKDGIIFKRGQDVYIRSRNPNGKIEDITDIVAEVDIEDTAQNMPYWEFVNSMTIGVERKDKEFLDLKSEHSITSPETIDEFVQGVINAPDNLFHKLRKLLSAVSTEMSEHPELPQLSEVKKYFEQK